MATSRPWDQEAFTRAYLRAAEEQGYTVERAFRDGLNMGLLRPHADSDVGKLEAEIEALEAEVERLRMQLAACGVLAQSNTPETLKRNRQMHAYYDCASVQDVIRCVEREIALRAENARLLSALEEIRPWISPHPHYEDCGEPLNGGGHSRCPACVFEVIDFCARVSGRAALTPQEQPEIAGGATPSARFQPQGSGDEGEVRKTLEDAYRAAVEEESRHAE